MSKSKLVWQGLLHALGVGLYVLLVSLIITSGEQWFGPLGNLWGPMLLLLLLCLSVAVIGCLIFLRPALLALHGEKNQAVWLLSFTLIWLAVFVGVIILSLSLRSS